MSKSSNRSFITMVFQFLVLVVVLSVVGKWFLNKSEFSDVLKDDLKEHVGETIYIKGEEYQILNYSLINRTFTLDDGREVSVELILKEDKETEY